MIISKPKQISRAALDRFISLRNAGEKTNAQFRADAEACGFTVDALGMPRSFMTPSADGQLHPDRLGSVWEIETDAGVVMVESIDGVLAIVG